MSPKTVILFSGGLDSTTCLALAKERGFTCYAISFDFGQKHRAELESAKRLASHLQVADHKILPVGLNQLQGSSLTDPQLSVPNFDKKSTAIPSTYVPARNTIFLSIALGWAEVLGAYDIFYGANFIDYAGYPDCRPDYIAAFEKLANLATKAGVEGSSFQIHTPLLYLNKSQIIHEGIRLGIDYSMTVSCYRADAEGRACGHCDSCAYRKKGFVEAGIEDPTRYY